MEMIVPHALSEEVDEMLESMTKSGKTRNRLRQTYLCNEATIEKVLQ